MEKYTGFAWVAESVALYANRLALEGSEKPNFGSQPVKVTSKHDEFDGVTNSIMEPSFNVFIHKSKLRPIIKLSLYKADKGDVVTYAIFATRYDSEFNSIDRLTFLSDGKSHSLHSETIEYDVYQNDGFTIGYLEHAGVYGFSLSEDVFKQICDSNEIRFKFYCEKSNHEDVIRSSEVFGKHLQLYFRIFYDKVNNTKLYKDVSDYLDEKEVIATKKSGCFIATAAMGDHNNVHVKGLRNFRDETLLKYEYGRKFVELYYKFSPPIAELIRSRGVLRFITRLAVVYPLSFLFGDLKNRK